jgi:hypothetical protein
MARGAAQEARVRPGGWAAAQAVQILRRLRLARRTRRPLPAPSGTALPAPERLLLAGYEVRRWQHAALWASRRLDGGPFPGYFQPVAEGPLPAGQGPRLPAEVRFGRLYLTVAIAGEALADDLHRLVICRPDAVYWADLPAGDALGAVYDRAAGVFRLPPPPAWLACNRRGALRVRVETDIRLLEPAGSARLLDLSATGARLALGQAVTVGARVCCALPMAGAAAVAGEVVWVRATGGAWQAGVRWQSLPDHVGQRIMHFVFRQELAQRRAATGRRPARG